MINKKIFIGIVFAIAILMAFGFQNSSEHKVLFEKAKFTMETKGDLKGAIKLFEEIIQKYPKQREYAAKSQLYIGLCYEKLGQNQANQAQKAFQKVVENYPDQMEAVKIAQEKLSRLSKVAAKKPQKPNFIKIQIPEKRVPQWSGAQLSPDGKKLAFCSGGNKGNIWVVPVPGEARPDKEDAPLKLTETGECMGHGLAWSSDGRWIAFNSWKESMKNNEINVISSSGREPKKIPVSTNRDYPPYLGLSLSPNGKVLAFASKEEEEPGKPKKSYIYTIPVEGGIAKRLNSADTCEPAFSPDGKKLAYSSKGGIWVIPAAGGTPVKVSDLSGKPVWSPDGKWIAFLTSVVGKFSNQVCIVRISKEGKSMGAPTKIKLPVLGFNYLAGWTPDNKMGFILHDRGQHGIYTLPASGGKATHVTQVPIPCYPRWSPDGRRIYFYHAGDIVYIPSRGGEVSTVPIRSDPRINHPAFKATGHAVSPDGEKITFSGVKQNKSGKGRRAWPFHIWTIPVEGGEPTELTSSPSSDFYPCWSPDGKSIAFTRVNNIKDSPPCIFTVPVEGGEVTQLTSASDKGDGLPKWSPDGKSIAYVSERNTIKVIPVQGGESRIVVKLEKAQSLMNFELAWLPDGEKLAYTSKGKIWKVSLDGGKPVEIQTGLDAWVSHISLSRDGKKIAFVAKKGGGINLWLMENFLPLLLESSQQEDDYRKLLGVWEVELELAEGYFNFSLNIEESNGKLTGAVSDSEGFFLNVPLSNIEYDGDKLNFELIGFIAPDLIDGKKHNLKAEFKVGENKLEGIIVFEDLEISGSATATRKKK